MADSYGPAQERRTRTPVEFEDLPSGTEGTYETSTPISKILASKRGEPTNQGTITVDPSQTNNVGRVIRHEAIHQVLSRLPVAQARSLAQSPTNFNPIANILRGGGRQGQPADEAPSYMGAYEPPQPGQTPTTPLAGSSETAVPPDWRTNYVNQLQQQLSSYPDIQKLYNQLSQ